MSNDNSTNTLTQAALPFHPTRAEVGAQIKQLRTKLDCSQDELAKALNVPPALISVAERGAPGARYERVLELLRSAQKHFNPPTATAPAEVDTAAPVTPQTQEHIDKCMTALRRYMDTYGASTAEVAKLLGISDSHTYQLLNGRPTTSQKLRDAAMVIVARETKLRSQPQAQTAPAPTPTKAQAVPGILVRGDALAGAIKFDFTTKHRFHRLPDGSIFVVQEG